MSPQRRGAAHVGRPLTAVGAAIAVVSSFAGVAAAQPTANATPQIKASITGRVLNVSGTSGPDDITLTPASATSLGIVDTASGSLLFAFNGSDFDTINVFTFGGDDEVRGTNGIARFGQFTIDG